MHLHFYSDFFGHMGERLDKETKVHFTTYDVIYWETNNYNTHIAKSLKK